MNLEKSILCYLASPYSKYPHGLDMAVQHAAELVGKIMKRGLIAVSPIIVSHEVSKNSDIDPLSHEIWLAYDEGLLARCDLLIIAMLEGWEESVGIAWEIDYCERNNKAYVFLDPETMMMYRGRNKEEEFKVIYE